MADEKVATFKIEKETWKAFQDWTKEQNSNASRAIKEFINACLDGNVELGSIGGSKSDSNQEKRLTRTEQRLSVIEERLGKVERSVLELDVSSKD